MKAAVQDFKKNATICGDWRDETQTGALAAGLPTTGLSVMFFDVSLFSFFLFSICKDVIVYNHIEPPVTDINYLLSRSPALLL